MRQESLPILLGERLIPNVQKSESWSHVCVTSLLAQDLNHLIRLDGRISGNSHENMSLESVQPDFVTRSDLKLLDR